MNEKDLEIKPEVTPEEAAKLETYPFQLEEGVKHSDETYLNFLQEFLFYARSSPSRWSAAGALDFVIQILEQRAAQE